MQKKAPGLPQLLWKPRAALEQSPRQSISARLGAGLHSATWDPREGTDEGLSTSQSFWEVINGC